MLQKPYLSSPPAYLLLCLSKYAVLCTRQVLIFSTVVDTSKCQMQITCISNDCHTVIPAQNASLEMTTGAISIIPQPAPFCLLRTRVTLQIDCTFAAAGPLPSLAFARQAVSMLMLRYPSRLGTLFLVNAGSAVYFLWSAASMLLPLVSRSSACKPVRWYPTTLRSMMENECRFLFSWQGVGENVVGCQ